MAAINLKPRVLKMHFKANSSDKFTKSYQDNKPKTKEDKKVLGDKFFKTTETLYNILPDDLFSTIVKMIKKRDKLCIKAYYEGKVIRTSDINCFNDAVFVHE